MKADLEVTNGIKENVYSGLLKAIQSKNHENISIFIKFYKTVIVQAIKAHQLKHFSAYIDFPVDIYRAIVLQEKQDGARNFILESIAESLPLYLREIVQVYINISARKAQSDVERLGINNFYYHSFNSFGKLFYLQTRLSDWRILQKGLEYFSNIGEGGFQNNRSTRIESSSHINAEIEKSNGTTKKKDEIAKKYDEYKRQTSSMLKYWLYFLFENDLIDLPTLNELIKSLNTVFLNPADEIRDLLFVRSSDLRDYMSWEGWDYLDRSEGSHRPPMISDWATLGFVVERIRTGNPYFNIMDIEVSLQRDLIFLSDKVLEIRNRLLNQFEKWKRVLNVERIEELYSLIDRLLSNIKLAKRSVVSETEEAIASEELSIEKVSSFIKSIGNTWKREARIRKVFSSFDNIKDVTDESILLRRVGQDMFLEKGKIMFINGPNSQHIYGIEQIGGHIGRFEDNLFFHSIQTDQAKRLQGSTVLETLTVCINDLKKRGINPSVIFLEPEYAYKDEDFLQSHRYSPPVQKSLNTDDSMFSSLGTFDELPIYSSYSDWMKNRIVVADFKNAFLMLRKLNSNWFDNTLLVDVQEITDELAREKYLQEPERWQRLPDGIQLAYEEAITLIKNSVRIDVETITDFTVLDYSRYNIGIISSPIPD